ncbi:MAG: fimbrillin family protein [Mediterranea sp.]|nr:fimbrillin family protein [Mediterranea sp.]
MMKNKLIYLSSAVLLALVWGGCSEQEEPLEPQLRDVQISSSVASFDGEHISTRVNTEGTQFNVGDRMRLKIICPYVTSKEIGEDNWNAYDAFWLNKWHGSGWTPLTGADGCDINGDGRVSGASNMQTNVAAQQTPYVYTASTWSREVVFRTTDEKTIVQYVPVFHADQSDEKAYQESDLLWAQTVMQTATDRIHLNFHHVMCALHITFSATNTELQSVIGDPEVVLTLERMPDIDGAEVVVGDYYAQFGKDTYYRSNYGYKQKSLCTDPQWNGKVLGIGVNDFAWKTAYTRPMSGNPSAAGATTPVANTGIYRAFRQSDGTFRLIVPPCELTENPVIKVRKDNRYWTSTLQQTKYEQGVCYSVTVKF